MPAIVLVTGRYQLGNDPGLFQDAHFIGFKLALPFTKTWIDPNTDTITFRFYTHDVETWGTWKGHRVAINDTEIGRLKDGDDLQGTSEQFSIAVKRDVLIAALNSKDQFILSVELELQEQTPGLADDFVLWRIETDGSFAARLGWK